MIGETSTFPRGAVPINRTRKIACLYCGRIVAPGRRGREKKFCSPDHGREYHDARYKLAKLQLAALEPAKIVGNPKAATV